jgi:argininosuccinate synthase
MKIVLAYSGGLDTSVIVKWLKETYDAEIVTFAADVGQEEELKGLDKKALKTGASKHYTLDLVEEFARDFIYPMIRANAIYEGQYYLGTSIARPLIAKAQVDIAKKEKADTVAHGATGKGNDQCRFELTYMALAPAAPDHRAVEDRGLSRPVPRPRRDDRLLRKAPDSRRGLAQEALFDGPQPPAHLLRGGHP